LKSFQRIATSLLTLAVTAAVSLGAWKIATQKPSTTKSEKHDAPASVAKVVKEDELNTITLTQEAEQKIGIQVGAVESKPVGRVRVYGGEVTIPAGRAIPVASPLSGKLVGPPGGVPIAGQKVKTGQTIFELVPILTPDGRANVAASLVDADGQVNSAKAQLTLAEIALERAKRVLKEGAGSQRQVDEAQAAFDVATRTLDAATARRSTLSKALGEGGTNSTPIPITAPEDGILRTVIALPGQTVPLGAALFEVVDLSTVWLRVPLPVGDLDNIERNEPARVGKLSSTPGDNLTLAKPVLAPPSGNLLNSTVDTYYELPNTNGLLIPGQRLGVTVPLTDAKTSLTLPWSAVVFDVHGGTWVYEKVGPQRYARRRIVVQYTIGTDAVLQSGPSAGATIVTKGVQQLFGVETGFVK
jgi:cobalt-zinc-cadmium efflux system membrane fusion protein